MKMQKLGQSSTESPTRDSEQVSSVLDLDAMEGLLKEADGQSPAVPDSNAATAPELACESVICRQWTPCALVLKKWMLVRSSAPRDETEWQRAQLRWALQP